MRNKIILSDGVTELTKIKNFRYVNQVGFDNSQFRYGSVCSNMIEFDYYIDGNSILSDGDTITYYQNVDVDETFNPLPSDGTRDIKINEFLVTNAETEKITCHVVAYDFSIKLDVDYSQRLKELSGNFPQTILYLLLDAANYCGLTFTPPVPSLTNPILTFPISEFYVPNITAKDIFIWASELSGDNTFCVDQTLSLNRYSFNPTGWNNRSSYIICPTDQHTYKVTESGVEVTKTNVFYKESGLTVSPTQQNLYDGVKILDSNGNELGSYIPSGVSDPSIFYYINGNILASVVDAPGGLGNGARLIYERLADISGYYPIKARLFTFRNPMTAGGETYVVDGRLPYAQQVPWIIPINRVTVTESEAIVEAFGIGESESSYSPHSRSTDNSILTIKQDLDDLVFVTLSESVNIGGGSPSSPATVTVTQANFKPSGTDFFCLVGARINQYPLPYISASAGGIGGTYIEQVSFSGNDVTITLKNLIGAWGSGYSIYAVFAFKKT